MGLARKVGHEFTHKAVHDILATFRNLFSTISIGDDVRCRWDESGGKQPARTHFEIFVCMSVKKFDSFWRRPEIEATECGREQISESSENVVNGLMSEFVNNLASYPHGQRDSSRVTCRNTNERDIVNIILEDVMAGDRATAFGVRVASCRREQ
ncbi:hypothetical protein Tcan_12591 [Toxocara canis]|uniref:Uncharacterized protein n=1 Tax=Toxocara canis TaxID=6265 RepID=A0A0B2V0N2_TOXCA|nr:hypothetical protein Tcan_12591 [Toxocara canis]